MPPTAAWSKRMVSTCAAMELMSQFLHISLHEIELSQSAAAPAKFELFHDQLMKMISSWVCALIYNPAMHSVAL